jgi:hypothetical protein
MCVSLVGEVSTLRRHLASYHSVGGRLCFGIVLTITRLQGEYQQWAKKHNFESMLAADTAQRKRAATASRQGTLDDHVQEIPRPERVVPYSNAGFREAAIKWLVSTDQVSFSLPFPYVW